MKHVRKYNGSAIAVHCDSTSWRDEPNVMIYSHIDIALSNDDVCVNCMRAIYEMVAAKYVSMSQAALKPKG